MTNFIVPFINVSTIANPLVNHNININNSSRVNYLMGKVKNDINFDELLACDSILTNEDFVQFVEESNYTFIPIPGYYDENVKKHFDIYGLSYTVNLDGYDFIVKVYFYKIKNIELITKEFIEKFKLIFQYDYFTKNNILNMDWHSYRLTLFTNDIEQEKFLNLKYDTPSFCKSKLFHHQINNISNMLDIYQNPHTISITDNLIMHFDNGLIYDFVKGAFIDESDITTYTLKSGMILDEPGTGKTLQFIVFLIECNRKSLVLVPNDAIKKNWFSEFEKHINFEIIKSNIEIMTFDEMNLFLLSDANILDNFEIIGIDEIHIIYANKKYAKLYESIIQSKINSRWGITGTPFVNDLSLFNIIQFIVGRKFQNERIANIPSLQNNLVRLFLKNMKINMNGDYQFPELLIENIFVELDLVQQNLYEMESRMTFNKTNLRKLVSEVQMMYGNNDIRTPQELKMFAIDHYKKLYDSEVEKLQTLQQQLDNIKQNEAQFSKDEFEKREKHYQTLFNSQNDVVKRQTMALAYFTNVMESISKIFEKKKKEDESEMDVAPDEADDDDDIPADERCPICYTQHKPPIKYFKKCGHYFCGECIDIVMKSNNYGTNTCPMCRKEITDADIIVVNEIADINHTPKIHELFNIISKSSDRFIIFSQFDILDKFKFILNKNGISAVNFSEFSAGVIDSQVLLLSSQSNAEGINLCMFDKLIIFEPFEDHMYSKEIEKQLIGRIHRIGRVKRVDVFRLITKQTIEEEIYSQFS